MKTLTIDRGEWLTGQAWSALDESSALYNRESGLKCCMGIYGSELGIPNEDLYGGTLARSAETEWLKKEVEAVDVPMCRFMPHHGRVEDALISVNDQGVPDEEKIAYLFRKYGGIEVTFIGRYDEATSKAVRSMQSQRDRDRDDAQARGLESA